MNRHFSMRTVSELTGASARQIDYWARTGLLRPSGRDAAGRGSRRQYTFLDVVALLAIRQLRERGCPLQKIRVSVRHLRRTDPTQRDNQQLARMVLLTDGKHVYTPMNEHTLMEVVSRQHVWSVALGKLILEARRRVEALPMEWTEPVRVKGATYHLLVTSDPDEGGFIVQCKELPGALEQGETAKEAVANGRDAIESVLSVREQRRGAAKVHGVKAG